MNSEFPRLSRTVQKNCRWLLKDPLVIKNKRPVEDNSPLVSIVVRTLNRPLYLRECLESLERQDYRNLEVVVVNDGGPELGEFLSKSGLALDITLLEFRETVGRGTSGNSGLEHCSGKYIGFLDDDDIYYPFHISTLVGELERGDYKVVYSDSLRASQIICPFDPRVYMTVNYDLHYSEDFSLGKLAFDNFLPILCVLFERSCLGTLDHYFDLQLDALEDWEFWIRLGEKFEFKHLPLITSEYRFRLDGTNTQGQLDHVWGWGRQYISEKHAALRARYEKCRADQVISSDGDAPREDIEMTKILKNGEDCANVQ